MNSPNLQPYQNSATDKREKNRVEFSLQDIDYLFLDLDGTLLDSYFDDYFWIDYVPEKYAEKKGLSTTKAKEILMAGYKSVKNTLAWSDLDYWSEKLELDIEELKREISHIVKIHPYVTDFFDYVDDAGKDMYLITNAHPKTIAVKMERVPIADRFKKIISSQHVGAAKEQYEFWQNLQKLLPYEKKRTLFIDDNERVLDSAREYGIKHLVHIAKPSSQLPAAYSQNYLSIINFGEFSGK